MTKSIFTLALLSTFSLSTVAAGYQAGDIVVRGGATMVNPDDSQTGVYLDGNETPLSVSPDDDTQLGLNFVYFFDTNWAIELLAATPFAHDVILDDPDGVTNSIYGIDLDNSKLADVKQLPPTLSALYYFDTTSHFKPYVGVGINYTIFFDEKFTDTPKAAGFSNLDADSSLGYSVQVGADYLLDENWHVNASARYMDISSDVSFDIEDSLNVGGLEGRGSASIDIDPMVYSIMLGYKF